MMLNVTSGEHSAVIIVTPLNKIIYAPQSFISGI